MMWLALILILTITAGLWRAFAGPTRGDRLLALQMFGTTGTAGMLLLAQEQGLPALRDAALVLALLAAITDSASGDALPGVAVTLAPRAVRCAVLGTGAIAQVVHLPLLSQMKGARLHSICDVVTERSIVATDPHRPQRPNAFEM